MIYACYAASASARSGAVRCLRHVFTVVWTYFYNLSKDYVSIINYFVPNTPDSTHYTGRRVAAVFELDMQWRWYCRGGWQATVAVISAGRYRDACHIGPCIYSEVIFQFSPCNYRPFIFQCSQSYNTVTFFKWPFSVYCTLNHFSYQWSLYFALLQLITTGIVPWHARKHMSYVSDFTHICYVIMFSDTLGFL